MESASWQRPLYGFEISQNQAKMPLKSGFSDGLGGGKICPLVTVPYIFLTSFISILGNSSAKVGNIFETTKNK